MDIWGFLQQYGPDLVMKGGEIAKKKYHEHKQGQPPEFYVYEMLYNAHDRGHLIYGEVLRGMIRRDTVLKIEGTGAHIAIEDFIHQVKFGERYAWARLDKWEIGPGECLCLLVKSLYGANLGKGQKLISPYKSGG